jgi:hypothetical protein
VQVDFSRDASRIFRPPQHCPLGGEGGGWSCLLPYGLAVRRQKVPTVIRAFLDMFLKKTILFYGFFWSFSCGNDVLQVLISHMEGPLLLPFVGNVNFFMKTLLSKPANNTRLYNLILATDIHVF